MKEEVFTDDERLQGFRVSDVSPFRRDPGIVVSWFSIGTSGESATSLPRMTSSVARELARVLLESADALDGMEEKSEDDTRA